MEGKGWVITTTTKIREEKFLLFECDILVSPSFMGIS